MSSRAKPPPDDVARCIVASGAYRSVPLRDIMRRIFGRQRVHDALQDPSGDPEFLHDLMELDAMVNRGWELHGITRTQGPYASDALEE